jgi:hypothetical protein
MDRVRHGLIAACRDYGGEEIGLWGRTKIRPHICVPPFDSRFALLRLEGFGIHQGTAESRLDQGIPGRRVNI